MHEAGDVEEGEDGEDFFVGGRGDLVDLKGLRDYVLVGDHDGFGEAGRAGAVGGLVC